jgi:hypothetical protein
MRPTPTDQKTRFGTAILSDGTLDHSFKGPIRLNRSRKWPYAQTYQEARRQSEDARALEIPRRPATSHG